MGIRIIKLPDVGEGVAEAELVEWHVKVGDSVQEDQVLAAVMTDKATVEIPAPVAGTVLALGGEVGGVLAVGSELVRLEVAGEGQAEVAAKPHEAAAAETGIDAEIIDLRTLLPLDLDTIVASVTKTGRCVIVHEATLTSGFGAELCALVQENCFYHLEAPIVRVTGWDTPYPHAQEWDYFPGPARVGRALKAAVEA